MKVFVIGGTQFSFKRLEEYILKLLNECDSIEIVNIQMHDVNKNLKEHQKVNWFSRMNKNDFDKLLVDSDLIIAHAGMGSVIQSCKFEKKLIVIPRLSAKAEHRNDHQVDTAKWLQSDNICYVAENYKQLHKLVEDYNILTNSSFKETRELKKLVSTIDSLIE